MASDSREERAVTLELPAELDSWIDDRAAELDVDRTALVVQVLSAYRATESLDAEDDLESVLEDAVGDAFEDRLAAELDARLEEAVEARLADAVDARLDDRLEQLRSEFQSKVVDVRERVIQVKREADSKAAADHEHEELDELADLRESLAAVESDLAALEETVTADVADLAERVETDLADADAERDALADRLDDVEDKLKRVAWVVSDLKDDVGGRSAHEAAVDRIKRAAAQEGVTTAACDSCGESVDVALLTEPECPHCEATVSDVRPTGGFLRKKARLVAAAQLEAGDEVEEG